MVVNVHQCFCSAVHYGNEGAAHNWGPGTEWLFKSPATSWIITEYNRVPADLACVSRYSLFIKNELKWHLHLHKERKRVQLFVPKWEVSPKWCDGAKWFVSTTPFIHYVHTHMFLMRALSDMMRLPATCHNITTLQKYPSIQVRRCNPDNSEL